VAVPLVPASSQRLLNNYDLGNLMIAGHLGV